MCADFILLLSSNFCFHEHINPAAWLESSEPLPTLRDVLGSLPWSPQDVPPQIVSLVVAASKTHVVVAPNAGAEPSTCCYIYSSSLMCYF
jgi:hypothetical protein